jgi:hypothetical protein
MAFNTVGDIQQEVLVRMNRTTTDSFITDAMLQDWTGAAHTWAAGLHKWPFTEGRVTTTFTTAILDDNGEVVINYPEGWKSDSIRFMQIAGKRVQKLQPYEYQTYREQNPSDSKRVYTDFGRLVLVNPNVGLSGTVMFWGQYTPAIDATDLTATTVFSNYEEDGNDAIIEKIISYIRRREHATEEALMNEQTATQKLEAIWKRAQDEQAMYQSGDNDGMWKRIDIINGAAQDDLNHRDRFY